MCSGTKRFWSLAPYDDDECCCINLYTAVLVACLQVCDQANANAVSGDGGGGGVDCSGGVA
ncbi:hypothetical protein BLOT_000682 [Blomia tropicalis]|nr:hypothetical protein BLOT_000682 [Blomia tropicalis]